MKRVLFALALLFPVAALAATLNIAWQAPTTCSDGSPIAQCPLTKFTIYSGLQGATKTVLANPGPTTTGFAALNTPPGTWCVEMTASSAGGESAHTAEVCKTIAAPVPAAPSGVTLTVTAGTTAFTLLKQKDAMVMIPVGTIASQTVCIADEAAMAHGVVYNAVPQSAVTFSGSVKPDIVFGQCS